MKQLRVKKYAALAVVICAVLPLLGCSTIARQLSAGTIVFDESLPPEETALVEFAETIHVLEYNGIAVEQVWYPNEKWRINKVTLPAGETSVAFDFKGSVQRGNTIFTFHGENIELRYSFEGGEKYTLGLYTESQGFFKNTDYGVRIWDNNNKEIKTWKLGEF